MELRSTFLSKALLKMLLHAGTILVAVKELKLPCYGHMANKSVPVLATVT